MKLTSAFYAFPALQLLTVFLCGCTSDEIPKPPGMPTLVPCSIFITQQDLPLAGAQVLLVPSDGAKDWYASGLTDEDGMAAMKSSSRWRGAPKGQYKVVVTKLEVEPSKLVAPPESDEVAYQRYLKRVEEEVRPVFALVDRPFTLAETTTLTLDVTGKTEQTFDVGKPVRTKL